MAEAIVEAMAMTIIVVVRVAAQIVLHVVYVLIYTLLYVVVAFAILARYIYEAMNGCGGKVMAMTLFVFVVIIEAIASNG